MEILKSITPKKISVSRLMSFRNYVVKPVDGLNIPHITVPSHLISKKRITEVGDNLSVDIRLLFNSLNADNLEKIKEELRTVIISKAKSEEMIKESAREILENFIIGEKNIKNYMHLLNAVSLACVLIPESSNNTKSVLVNNTKVAVSLTIGNFFLNNCKDMIFNFISEKYIRSLASLDQDDNDQLDEYNRKREKTSNLIITICCLYDQRHSANTKLTAIHLYPLMNSILNIYNKLQNSMINLGNPYDDQGCTDEDEYEILRKMCNLYAEQLYLFMSKNGNDFINDKDVIKGQTLADLVKRYKTEVVPTLTEAYLISRCSALTI